MKNLKKAEIIYKQHLFSKQYAVIVSETMIPINSHSQKIYNTRRWKYLDTDETVECDNVCAVLIQEDQIKDVLYQYTGAIVLSFFENIFRYSKDNSPIEKLKIELFIPKDWNKEISIIQLDYVPGRIFNYNQKTIGTNITDYTKVDLGELEVPILDYNFMYGNLKIRDMINSFTEEKLREIKLC